MCVEPRLFIADLPVTPSDRYISRLSRTREFTLPLSMTGFGAGEGPVAGGRLRIEIRTVNHRYFNLAARLPSELSSLEGELRERLRRDFDRGHVAVQGRWIAQPARSEMIGLDLERAKAVVARLRELQSALALSGEVSLELVARQPDVFGANDGQPVELTWAEVEPVVAAAAAECRAMRRREGEILAVELRQRLDLLEQAAQHIAARAPERLTRERDRLRAGVLELLDGRSVDEQRLAQELAFMADKLDITEELVRFGAHVKAAREAFIAERPVGKQLGFLAQELGREVNTMGAKANDADIAHRVIGMKGELEKFREQLENLE
jgi:uncharacterized protein (TIGR00255 family)